MRGNVCVMSIVAVWWYESCNSVSDQMRQDKMKHGQMRRDQTSVLSLDVRYDTVRLPDVRTMNNKRCSNLGRK